MGEAKRKKEAKQSVHWPRLLPVSLAVAFPHSVPMPYIIVGSVKVPAVRRG